MRWLRHAFAIERSEDFRPTHEQMQIVDRMCRYVVKRRMATAALLLLEMSRPLNYVSAQVMHFFRPLVAIVLDTREYELFSTFLEHRGSIDVLCRRIESFEAELAQPRADGEAEQHDSPPSSHP
jgi:hypothetical protein